MDMKENWLTSEKVDPKNCNLDINLLRACSKVKENAIHYVGGAQINGCMKHFVIDERQKKRLKNIITEAKTGDRNFGMTGVNQHWITCNVGKHFPEYYWKLQDQNLYCKWIEGPEGYTANIQGQAIQKYRNIYQELRNIFKGPPTYVSCTNIFKSALTNVANLCNYIGDVEMKDFFMEYKEIKICNVGARHAKSYNSNNNHFNIQFTTLFKVSNQFLQTLGKYRLEKIVPQEFDVFLNEHRE
eukprot:4639600-Ditylum_brightwellii.AAC.1